MAAAPTPTNDLPFFPPARDMIRPFDPPPLMMEWFRKPGLTKVRTWDGTEAWLVTRFREARKVLGDQRFSADPSKPGFPEKSAGYKGSIGKDKNIRTVDDPEHGQEKRFLARDFAVTRLNEMRPAIQAKVDSLIDDLLAKGAPAEFFEDFALAIPTMVICEMLGVPYEDRDWFAGRSYTCLSSEVDVAKSEAAGKELYDYIDGLIDLKQREPGNDLMTRLVEEALNPGLKTRKSCVELARIVLIAGHETTANMIALSVAALLHFPEQLALLKSDPSLVRNAVEELLRFLSVAHTGRRRVATADIEIGGTLIRAGEGVIIANSVSDRDENEFSDPSVLDVTRKNAKLNMAFGYGNHQCLGQMLSRVELEIVHSTLWRRMPTLQLAVPFEEVPFREDTSVYGIRALPIRW